VAHHYRDSGFVQQDASADSQKVHDFCKERKSRAPFACRWAGRYVFTRMAVIDPKL